MIPGLTVFSIALASAPLSLPIAFETNRGQSPAAVRFLAHTGGGTLFLTDGEAVYSDGESVVRMRLAGARKAARLAGHEPLPGRVNYFRGNDPSAWRRDIPTFARLEARSVYPGIDLVYRSLGSTIEFDFVLAPGADPAAIRLAFPGTRRIAIDPNGDLVLTTPAGDSRLARPFLYQESCAGRTRVDGGWTRRGRSEAGFATGAYDRQRRLIIDPALLYSSYLGGGRQESGLSIAVGADGGMYVAGTSNSTDFPGTASSPIQPMRDGGYDLFVARLNPQGNGIDFATYLGGELDEEDARIALDDTGAVYVAATSQSFRFPTVNAFQGSNAGASDVVVAKIDPTGSALVFSSYLGGGGSDVARGIGVDSTHNIHVTGQTDSDTFPLVAELQAMRRGLHDVFLTRIDAAVPPAVGFSTYLGGSGGDTPAGIAVEPSGVVHVGGWTTSTNFPTQAGSQMNNAGGADGFLFSVDAASAQPALVGSTYCGGTGNEIATAVAVSPGVGVFLAGYTDSDDFPASTGAHDGVRDLPTDGFVVRYGPGGGGSAVSYATLLGRIGEDHITAMRVDAAGSAYVAGDTDSPFFPLVDAFQTLLGGAPDTFVAKLLPDGSGLEYSSLLGGDDTDQVGDIAIDPAGSAYLVGTTASSDFPRASPLQNLRDGVYDAFVSKIGVPGCSLPGELGNLLRAAKSSPLAFRLEWIDPPGMTGYNLYEDSAKDGAFATPSGSAASGSPGIAKAIGPEPMLFYRLAGVNACGEGPR